MSVVVFLTGFVRVRMGVRVILAGLVLMLMLDVVVIMTIVGVLVALAFVFVFVFVAVRLGMFAGFGHVVLPGEVSNSHS